MLQSAAAEVQKRRSLTQASSLWREPPTRATDLCEIAGRAAEQPRGPAATDPGVEWITLATELAAVLRSRAAALSGRSFPTTQTAHGDAAGWTAYKQAIPCATTRRGGLYTPKPGEAWRIRPAHNPARRGGGGPKE